MYRKFMHELAPQEWHEKIRNKRAMTASDADEEDSEEVRMLSNNMRS